MPRNENGTYSLPSGNPVVPGTRIAADWANRTLNDIKDTLTASVSKDGKTTATANLPMGGFKHTSVADAVARDQYASLGQSQDGTHLFGGTAAALTGQPTKTATNSGTTATITTEANHRLATGSTVTVVGMTPAEYNGVFPVTVTGLKSYTYSMGSDPGGAATVLGTYSANVISITLTPAIEAYETGQRFSFINQSTNSGSSLGLSINGLTAAPLKKRDGSALVAGDLPPNTLIDVEYDGASFRVLGPLNSDMADPALHLFYVHQGVI